MVRHRVLGRTVGAVHAADVAGHVVAERAEQLAERAVHVEAVAASALVRDPPADCLRVDGPRLAEVQPHRLVRHVLDVRAVQPVQRRRPTAAPPRARAASGTRRGPRRSRRGLCTSARAEASATRSVARWMPPHGLNADIAAEFPAHLIVTMALSLGVTALGRSGRQPCCARRHARPTEVGARTDRVASWTAEKVRRNELPRSRRTSRRSARERADRRLIGPPRIEARTSRSRPRSRSAPLLRRPPDALRSEQRLSMPPVLDGRQCRGFQSTVPQNTSADRHGSGGPDRLVGDPTRRDGLSLFQRSRRGTSGVGGVSWPAVTNASDAIARRPLGSTTACSTSALGRSGSLVREREHER